MSVIHIILEPWVHYLDEYLRTPAESVLNLKSHVKSHVKTDPNVVLVFNTQRPSTFGSVNILPSRRTPSFTLLQQLLYFKSNSKHFIINLKMSRAVSLSFKPFLQAQCAGRTPQRNGLPHIVGRTVHSTQRRTEFHFDTHHFVQRLEREGLNRAQAEGIMAAMAEVIDESIRNMTSNMVTKADQEKVRIFAACDCHFVPDVAILQHHYTQQVDFAQLKSELQLTEKNDLAMLKAENDRLVTDIEKLKQRLREEITRTQAGVRLDLNLEKGRMREQSSGQELKIKEVDTRIEQEIANLRTTIQSSKVSFGRQRLIPLSYVCLQATTLQYLVGFGELMSSSGS